jgi:hypothetical protein
MGKILQFPRHATWPPLPLRRPVPSVRFTYVLDRDYPPGHPFHQALAVTLTDPRALLDPALPQPASRRLYDLICRHHNRQPRDWIVYGQLTAELAARGLDWPTIGLDPNRVFTGLARLCAAGEEPRGIIPERPEPTSPLARRLVRDQAGDPAMARHAPSWRLLQRILDEARLAAYLHAHPEAAHLTTLTTPSPAPRAADQGSGGREWCPSGEDDDAGYADEWTDEDEALAVAEANALYEREQAKRTAQTAAARPAQVGLVDADPDAWPQQQPARPRWWFHAFWWLVIIALTVGTYRLVS